MIKCLFFGFDVHFNTQTCCRKDYRVKIFREFALISNLVFEILVSDTKYVLNCEFLFGKLIVSFRVIFFLIIRWLFDVSLVLWICPTLLTFCFYQIWIHFLGLLLKFIEKLFIVHKIRIIFPNNYWLLLCSNTDHVLLFRIEFNWCYWVRMTFKFVENWVFNAWIIKQFDLWILISYQKDISSFTASLTTNNVWLSDTLCFEFLSLRTHKNTMGLPL